MKTSETKYKKWLTVLKLVAVGCAVFALGWHLGSNTTDKTICNALWKVIMDLPEPEECVLCSMDRRYHAPCLLDLSTGRMGEMKVYTEHPTKQGELAREQQTGTFHFQPCAGLMGVRDTDAHTCKVALPKERRLMDPVLFCRECRQLLAGTGLEGYVIIDLYDPSSIQAYTIKSEIIRDYRVSVTGRIDGAKDVCVTGLLG